MKKCLPVLFFVVLFSACYSEDFKQSYRLRVHVVDLNRQLLVGCKLSVNKGELRPIASGLGDFDPSQIGVWELAFEGSPGEEITFHISCPGHYLVGSWSHPLPSEQNGVIEVIAYPDESCSVFGHVIDTSKRPIPDAKVYVHKDNRILETTADANGEFSVPAGMGDGQPVLIEVIATVRGKPRRVARWATAGQLVDMIIVP